LKGVVETGASFLVIGSGLAGLSFSLRAAGLGAVILLTKSGLTDASTSHAQGGIAAVLGPDDDFSSHVEDTLTVGKGLCSREAVELMVKRGTESVRWLLDRGVAFDTDDGSLDLGKEGGHSRRRVAHVGDQTGNAIEEALVGLVKESPAISVNEGFAVVDLLMKGGRCVGVRGIDLEGGRIVSFYAPVTVLTSGGAGQLFHRTSNPLVATGDGLAMAFWAGVDLCDMEFVQFHPTILNTGKSPAFLISETVRGEGGILRNSDGEAFMEGIHPQRDLAPRDVVSRAIVEQQRRGPVFLDVRHKEGEFLRRRFPAIYGECLESGFRMEEDLIPVSPAAHYMCGGIKTNIHGETSLPGLFALGECACTGVHGANRMASNSLLECVVFSEMAYERVKGMDLSDVGEAPPVREVELVEIPGVAVRRSHLQDLMWDYAGINRSVSSLNQALSEINSLEEMMEELWMMGLDPALVELSNMVTVARLITQAALTRKESRGTHHVSDYPETDDENWLKHIVFSGSRIRLEDHAG
jgi:L-aspartate oxidase